MEASARSIERLEASRSIYDAKVFDANIFDVQSTTGLEANVYDWRHRKHSLSEKMQIVKAIESGIGTRALADQLGVHRNTIRYILRKKDSLPKAFSDSSILQTSSEEIEDRRSKELPRSNDKSDPSIKNKNDISKNAFLIPTTDTQEQLEFDEKISTWIESQSDIIPKYLFIVRRFSTLFYVFLHTRFYSISNRFLGRRRSNSLRDRNIRL